MSRKQKVMVSLLAVSLAVVITLSGIGWNFTQRSLALARSELTGAQVVLATKESELSTVKGELLDIKSELKSTQSHLLSTESELQSTNNYLLNIKTELEETKTRLANLQVGAYNLHNPTFDEVIEFLEKDQTDQNEYVEGEYVCTHFVRDVNNNAERQGVRTAIVLLTFPQQSHAIVGFNTVDKGMVYFDAITDDRVRPVIGKEYWRCVEPRNGRHYTKPEFDDTIEDIIIIW